MLMRPSPDWNYCKSSLDGANPALLQGTTVTSGINDAMGTPVQLLAAVDFDIEQLVVGFTAYNAGAANGSCLADILFDPAGGSSWQTIIPTISMGYVQDEDVNYPLINWFTFPVWIRAGSTIGAQVQTAHTVARAGKMFAIAYGGNANPGSWWCGQKVEAIGIDAATSQGTNHTSGNSGSFSSWTNFGSTLSRETGALIFNVQGTNTDTGMNTSAYHFEFGVGSQAFSAFHLIASSSELTFAHGRLPNFVSLAAGTQLQVRGTCSGTSEALDVAAWAVS